MRDLNMALRVARNRATRRNTVLPCLALRLPSKVPLGNTLVDFSPFNLLEDELNVNHM